jgi:hypothetical protein
MFLCIVRKSRVNNYGFGKVGIRFVRIDNPFNESTVDRFGWVSRIGKRVSIMRPVPTIPIPISPTLLPSFLNPLSPCQSDPLCDTEKSFEFSPSTHHDQQVLSIVFDSEDRGKRHIDIFEQFWVQSTRKITERVEERIGDELNSAGEVL